ncbi:MULTISPECIES: lipoyl(octanoyl) transferase LipB [unclassified Hyphomicrobium]|uniref:lipoyl(octanoyl) transferase LipB n=1 Tax=unclassified Hyphomicrobium TaxID=2619925 RepID=UPI000213D81B|nr:MULTISPECIES: lipoyl(octanoyl) transferase LipB [unclassified Hyphomicrobium]CCB64418.1 Lipoyltransferase (Lipoyl-[acyl-carrier protein]-protein-N-lipoyltransferase) (Lipoate-protein ligase B) [Hyphomicrobium sp. MC1]
MKTLTSKLPNAGTPARVEWAISEGYVDYDFALEVMRRRTSEIRDGTARELVWLLEHPPLYTAGTSAKDEDLLNPNALPVFRTARGGQFTYHGPGQRVAYVMLDLETRGRDIRDFITRLELWLINALAEFNVTGEIRRNRVGIWVRRSSKGEQVEDKIAAIGLHVSRWVSSHGVALNVDPDLSQFGGIVPCGIRDHGVTSLADLGLPVSMYDMDVALRTSFQKIFGPTKVVDLPVISPQPGTGTNVG